MVSEVQTTKLCQRIHPPTLSLWLYVLQASAGKKWFKNLVFQHFPDTESIMACVTALYKNNII